MLWTNIFQVREFWQHLPLKLNLELFPEKVANLVKIEAAEEPQQHTEEKVTEKKELEQPSKEEDAADEKSSETEVSETEVSETEVSETEEMSDPEDESNEKENPEVIISEGDSLPETSTEALDIAKEEL